MQLHRLTLLCGVFRLTVGDVLRVLQSLQVSEFDRIVRLSDADVQPWVTFRKRGDLDTLRAEQALLQGWIAQTGI